MTLSTGWGERLCNSRSERVEIARIPLPVEHPVVIWTNES